MYLSLLPAGMQSPLLRGTAGLKNFPLTPNHQDQGLWSQFLSTLGRGQTPTFSRSRRRIASSSTSGAGHLDPSPTNSTWPVSDDTLSHSSFHGRRHTSWDRGPPGAATSGHGIRHPPTSSHAIPDRHPRYRSRERTLRRTCPSLVEGRGGEGVGGVWW